MVRVLNFFCFALMGLSILALYDVSERTRVATVALGNVETQIAAEQSHMSVLETEWEQAARPEKVHALAVNRLGLSGAPTLQLTSFDALPRRGEDAPLSQDPIRDANLQTPTN